MSEGFNFVQSLRFSMFWGEGDNTKNCHPLKVISFEDLVSLIMNKELKGIDKKERPYFTPYGTFSYRNNSNLLTYNQDLVSLDYDKITPEQVTLLDKYWSSRRSTLLSMRSPSGNGLKVLLWAETGIDIKQGTQTHYETLKYNRSIFTIMGIVPDPAQFVLSQPFFIPYNEEFYFNFHPKKEHYPFTKKPTPPPRPVKKPTAYKFHKKEYSLLINIEYSLLIKKPLYVKPPLQLLENPSSLSVRNQFFIDRCNYFLSELKKTGQGEARHQKVFWVLMNLFPYLDQQTAITEAELILKLEDVVRFIYGSRDEISALHRSIKEVKSRTGGMNIETEMGKYLTRRHTA